MWGTDGKSRELKIVTSVGAIMHEPFPPLLWRPAMTANRPDVPLSLDDVGH